MDCRAFGLSLSVFLSVAATALGEDGAPKFETRVIEISGKRVTVEVADDDERRAYGAGKSQWNHSGPYPGSHPERFWTRSG